VDPDPVFPDPVCHGEWSRLSRSSQRFGSHLQHRVRVFGCDPRDEIVEDVLRTEVRPWRLGDDLRSDIDEAWILHASFGDQVAGDADCRSRAVYGKAAETSSTLGESCPSKGRL
jgi:hypothetical protein